MNKYVECPQCGLPMRLCDSEKCTMTAPHWVCNGPNGKTKARGCGYISYGEMESSTKPVKGEQLSLDFGGNTNG